jgi:hypothetical protein
VPPKSYRPLPSDRSLPRFYPTGGAQRRAQFFRGRAHQGGIAERKAMIDRGHDLSITRQAEVLRISRGSVYYLPRPVPEADLAIMRRLDRLHLEYRFADVARPAGGRGVAAGSVGKDGVRPQPR